jgi:hypothetical protein
MVKKFESNFFVASYIFYNQSKHSVTFGNLKKNLNFLGRIFVTSQPKKKQKIRHLKKHTPFDKFSQKKRSLVINEDIILDNGHILDIQFQYKAFKTNK